MTSLQCVNCNVRLDRIRRHALSEESEDLVNTIRLWTFPRDVTPADHVCHACWQLASHAHSSNNASSRQVGHQSVCVVCGRSILRISRRRILFEGANEDQQRTANAIAFWIQPRDLRFEDEACVPCWLRARRTRITPPVEDIQQYSTDHVDGDHSILMCAVCGQSLSTTTSAEEWNPDNDVLLLEHQQMSSMNEVCGVCWRQAQQLNYNVPEGLQNRPQYIVLPNIRRAAESPRHCIFQECIEPERNVVPEEIRRDVLIKYQYFIPKGAHICSLHRQDANYANLYTAEYSLNNFSSIHIEEIIFILMEGLHNISYENIQNYPDNQVHYFIGISKQKHAQILEATPRLRNMHRGSFALTVLLCKLRTGDSGDRLSCLFQVPRRTLETLMSVARAVIVL